MGSNLTGAALAKAIHDENREWKEQEKQEADARERGRREIAMKITMAVVDRIVNEIIRPGPKPEERECYVMAGELRAITPELEALVKQVIDVNEGVQ